MRDIYKLERVFEDDEFSFMFMVCGEAIIYATSMWQLYNKIVLFYDAFYDDETYRNSIDVFLSDFDGVTSEFNSFQKKIIDIRAERKKEQLEFIKATARELPF